MATAADLTRRHLPTRRRRGLRAHSAPPDRTLHLIDLENLAGGPRPDAPNAFATIEAYLHLAAWHPGDHVVLAANGWLLRQVVFDLPSGWLVRGASGPDGADLVLLAVADPSFVVARYRRLVVGSGDGIFAPLLAEVGCAGVATTVISRRAHLARCLERAAQSRSILPDLHPAAA